MIGEPEEAAHIGRLHPHEGMLSGIFLKNIIENAGIIQIFGNGDGQRLIEAALFAAAKACSESGASMSFFNSFSTRLLHFDTSFLSQPK